MPKDKATHNKSFYKICILCLGKTKNIGDTMKTRIREFSDYDFDDNQIPKVVCSNW